MVATILPWWCSAVKQFSSVSCFAWGRSPFDLALIFEDFSTLEMKKFPYLTIGPFGNPIVLSHCHREYLRKDFRCFFQIFTMAVIWRLLTWFPVGGQVVPSGKVVFSQAKVPVRDPMASTKPMLNILTVYLTLHKARLTVTVLNTSLFCHSYLFFIFWDKVNAFSAQKSSHKKYFN